ncbi:MAG TPA: hypothetical protein VIU16_03240, partial [Gaiellaceae bacterium]
MLITADPNPTQFKGTATVVLFGGATQPVNPGSIWTLTLDGFVASHTAGSGETLRTVANALAALLNAHFGTATATVEDRTRFKGDFGTAVVRESSAHDSVFTAQDLDLARWNKNASRDIEQATVLPHLTVLGTGNGEDDFYKFEITSGMRDGTGGDGVTAIFDIDHGFEWGDPVLWASQLRLYKAIETAGTLTGAQLIAQGPGFTPPDQGALGSTTWLDDLLRYTFTETGTYFLEVGKWYPWGNGGLPDGVDYQLQVSLENHPVDGFVFAPEPVLEDEQGNNSTSAAQDISSLNNFFTFYDSSVGDTDWTTASGSSRAIDFLTPYARVRGSGDGSFDVFSFQVTPAMLDPSSVNIPTTGGSVTDPHGPFFTELDTVLDGDVRVGDVWRLGLRYRNYAYTVQQGDTLATIAAGLLSALDPRFKTTGNSSAVAVDTAGNVHLVIRDANGFNLQGLPVDGVPQNGLTQEVQNAG